MKKNVLNLILLSLAFNTAVKAQDLIILKDGIEIKSVVSEVLETQIKFKKYENKSGPSYTIEKSRVFMIKYENGTKDLFDTPSKLPIVTADAKLPTVPAEVNKLGNSPQLTITGRKIFKNGSVLLKKEEVEKILSSYPLALDRYKSGKNTQTVGNVLGVVSLILVFGSLEQQSREGKGIGTAVAGLGVNLVGVVLFFSGKRKISEGINLYNASQKNTSFILYPSLNKNGVGICMKF